VVISEIRSIVNPHGTVRPVADGNERTWQAGPAGRVLNLHAYGVTVALR